MGLPEMGAGAARCPLMLHGTEQAKFEAAADAAAHLLCRLQNVLFYKPVQYYQDKGKTPKVKVGIVSSLWPLLALQQASCECCPVLELDKAGAPPSHPRS